VLIPADRKFLLTLGIRSSLKKVAMLWGRISRTAHVLFCYKWSRENFLAQRLYVQHEEERTVLQGRLMLPPKCKLVLFLCHCLS